MVEHRSPKPSVEGSSPSWRASHYSVSSHLGAYVAASILEWDFKRSVIAVMLGVILAGIIMGTLSLLLGVNTFAH